MNPDSLGAVNKRVTTEVLRKRKSEPNLSESDSEYSTDNSSRSKRKYRGNLFIFIFLGGAPTSISRFFRSLRSPHTFVPSSRLLKTRMYEHISRGLSI